MTEYSFTDDPQEAADRILAATSFSADRPLDEKLLKSELNAFMAQHGEQLGYAGIVKAQFRRQVEAMVRAQHPKPAQWPPEDWDDDDDPHTPS